MIHTDYTFWLGAEAQAAAAEAETIEQLLAELPVIDGRDEDG